MSKKLAKLSRSSLDQLRDDIDTLDDFRKGLDQRLGTKGRWGVGALGCREGFTLW